MKVSLPSPQKFVQRLKSQFALWLLMGKPDKVAYHVSYNCATGYEVVQVLSQGLLAEEKFWVWYNAINHHMTGVHNGATVLRIDPSTIAVDCAYDISMLNGLLVLFIDPTALVEASHDIPHLNLDQGR